MPNRMTQAMRMYVVETLATESPQATPAMTIAKPARKIQKFMSDMGQEVHGDDRGLVVDDAEMIAADAPHVHRSNVLVALASRSPQADTFLNRSVAKLSTPTPIASSIRICGISTCHPAPRRNTPRTITR
jgi:hypothetical protein